MISFINTPLFQVSLTLVVFITAKKLQNNYKSPLLNPILITILVVIGFLLMSDISYNDYKNNTIIISFWLAPSVIALGYALYNFIEEIKNDVKRILLAMFLGSLTGIVSVIGFAFVFGASKLTIISLAPKSVTTPIAIEVSKQMGGVPPLTVAFVIVVGVFGAVFGQAFLKIIGVKNAKAVGLSLGASAHALGTASISAKGPDYSAFGGLGMALNGIITAVIAPWIVQLAIYLLY